MVPERKRGTMEGITWHDVAQGHFGDANDTKLWIQLFKCEFQTE